MKLSHFIIYVLIGIAAEYFLRLVFPGILIVIVPELLIFLTILNLRDKNVLTKFTIAAVLYDLWLSPQLGTVAISLLMMFAVLYMLSAVSFLNNKNILGKPSISRTLIVTILSELLLAVYYFSSYLLDKISLTWHNPELVSQAWGWSQLANFTGLCLATVPVFLILYFGYSLHSRSI